MKRLLSIFFTLLCFATHAQNPVPIGAANSWVYIQGVGDFTNVFNANLPDTTASKLIYPLKLVNRWARQNGRLYFNPTGTRFVLVDDVPAVDTTSLSNRINAKPDSTETILNQSAMEQPGKFNISESGQARSFTSDTMKISRQSIFTSVDSFTLVGDSWTAGTGSTNGGYAGQFAAMTGATIVNRGIPGSTMQAGVPLNPFGGASQALVNRLSDIPVKAANQRFLICQIGLNDFGYNGGTYDTAGYKAACRVWINNAISKVWSPGEIIFLGPGYANATGYTTYAGLSGNPAPNVTRHLQYVDAARKVCQEYPGLLFIDLYDLMRGNGGNALLAADGFHPNNTGAIFIASYLYNLLNGYGYFSNPGKSALDGETVVSNMIIAAKPTGSLLPSLRWQISGPNPDTTGTRIPGAEEYKNGRRYIVDSALNRWQYLLVTPGYVPADTTRLIQNNATATPQSASINITGNILCNGAFATTTAASQVAIGTNSPSGKLFVQMTTGGTSDDIEFNTIPTNTFGRVWFRSGASDHAWILWGGATYAGSGLFQANGFNLSNRKSGGPFTLSTTGTGPINLAPGGDNLSNIKVTVVTTGVGIGTTTPNASAALHIAGLQGFLQTPISQAQRDAIGTPGTGLMVTVSDGNYRSMYNGVNWTGDIVVSAAGTLTLTHGDNYVFTGATTTWTLPAVSASLLSSGNQITIKNRGSGDITLNSNAGNTIYSTTATGSITIPAGSSVTLVPDGTYFNVE